METVTVYKDSYEELQRNEFRLMTELAELKGIVSSLAKMEGSPEFVFDELKKLAEKYK